MLPIYLFLVSSIGTMIWAMYTKYQQHKFTDLCILLLTAIAVCVNVYLVHQLIVGDLSVGLHAVQMGAASCIVPLAYLYFARQVGHQTANNTAMTLLWMLAAMTFIPEIIIYNPFEPLVMPESGLQPFTVYVIDNGEKRFAMHTGEFVTILQCIVTILRIIPFMALLRRYNLQFNSKVYAFGAAWALIIVFVIMVSSMSYEELRSPIGSWFYFTFHGLLVTFINILIAKRYDIYPIETEEQEVVEDLHAYMQQQTGKMAGKLAQIMDEQQLYLDPQVTADHVIELLHTNHTYFSQMMSSEWGMSFSEYLNSKRLARVEQLMHDESLTLSAIATQSGFADASYMSRKFKAKHGITPSEYRKQFVG